MSLYLTFSCSGQPSFAENTMFWNALQCKILVVHLYLLDLFNFMNSRFLFFFFFYYYYYYYYYKCKYTFAAFIGRFFLPWLELVKKFCSSSVIFFSIPMMQFLQKLEYGKKLYIETSFRGLKFFGIQDDSVKDELIWSCIYFLVALASLYALYSLCLQNSVQPFIDLEQQCIMTIIFSLLSCALL